MSAHSTYPVYEGSVEDSVAINFGGDELLHTKLNDPIGHVLYGQTPVLNVVGESLPKVILPADTLRLLNEEICDQAIAKGPELLSPKRGRSVQTTDCVGDEDVRKAGPMAG